MSRRRREGNCHICGTYGKLSFEHVPPKSAFNDRPICTPDIRKIIQESDPDIIRELRGKTSQLGAGGYTLCEPCNNNTGHWFGAYYASWTYQAYSYLLTAKSETTLSYPYYIYPLHVLKQIICMFFSINSPKFREKHEDLVRFALNPRDRYMPGNKRIFVAYTNSDRSRQSGVTGLLKFDSSSGGATSNFYSEISFPPFTYLLCLDSEPPDSRLMDITFFSHYGYSEFAMINLAIQLLPIYTWLPGDFRNRAEVRKQLELAGRVG